MYLITGGVGFLACVIFIILIIAAAMRGKSCVVPLVAFVLALALFLGSGFLYSRTDPEVGGVKFLEFITKDKTVPPNLLGEWKEAVDSKADSYHGIYIFDDVIEIYWVSDGGKSRTLYWAGTYEAPTDGQEPYTWESHNDTRRTSAALLASGDSVKEFTYKNGKLTYSASVLGVTTKIEAEKLSWGYMDPVNPPVDTEEPSAPAPEDEVPAENVSGDLGSYHVEIKGAAPAVDYEGHPAIVVTCAWTNNSGDTLSAATALAGKAFQNGVELDAAMIIDAEVYDQEMSLRAVRPGTSIDVQFAYVLTSDTALVELELSSLRGDTSEVVSTTFDPAAIAVAE